MLLLIRNWLISSWFNRIFKTHFYSWRYIISRFLNVFLIVIIVKYPFLLRYVVKKGINFFKALSVNAKYSFRILIQNRPMFLLLLKIYFNPLSKYMSLNFSLFNDDNSYLSDFINGLIHLSNGCLPLEQTI